MRAGFGLLAGLHGSSAGNEREGWKGSLSRRLARLSAPSGYSLLQKSTRGGGALFQRRQTVVRGGGSERRAEKPTEKLSHGGAAAILSALEARCTRIL